MVKITTDIKDFATEYERIKEDLLSDLVDAMQKCKYKRNYIGLTLSILLFVLIEVFVSVFLYKIVNMHPVVNAIIILISAIFAVIPMTFFLFEEPDENWKKYSVLYAKYKKELSTIDALELLGSDTKLESNAKKTYQVLKAIEKIKDKPLEKLCIENNKLVVNDVVFTDFHAEVTGMQEVVINYIDNKVVLVCH